MDEAENAFAFLKNEFSMMGPERSAVVLPAISYGDKNLRFRILLEEMSVTTRLEIETDHSRLVADLPEVVRAAKIGASNDVVRVAHSLRGLIQALESQAMFVRKVYPLVISGDAVKLLEASGARKWRKR